MTSASYVGSVTGVPPGGYGCRTPPGQLTMRRSRRARSGPRSEPDHQAMVVISKENFSVLPGACRESSLPALIQPAWEPDTTMTCCPEPSWVKVAEVEFCCPGDS